MISTNDLMDVANERLADAEILLNAQRYDSAAYLCGYSLEIALKYKICQTLNWIGFPSANKEFEKYKSLKTHDLDVLLSFTGIETILKETHLSEWSGFNNWNPEARYNRIGTIKPAIAVRMVNSARKLIEVI